MDGAPTPRWLADEMLGRLARYLRFFGFDTEYLRGQKDEELARLAAAEGRVLLTRDRDLARRTPGSLLLRSPEIGAQLREVRRSAPQLEFRLRFDRCPECNLALQPWVPPREGPWPSDLPIDRVRAGLPVYECRRCSMRFWEGSHSDRIRERVREWLEPEVGP